jgi:uncharacterized protein with ATP-grasp and redox domains
VNTQFECIPCIINSYLRLVKTGIIPESQQEPILRRLLKFLSLVDYNQSPPVLGRRLHGLIREFLQKPDPYRQIKKKYNRMMLELIPEFKEMVAQSSDPFNVAMRLAIAGNVIDFGPQHQLDVMDTIQRVRNAKLAIDDSRYLYDDLKNTTTLLYIGDNCGEIVFDKLFLETINLPKMYFAVRGGPIINDATLDDAKMVGMEKVAEVITTGDDSPGAVWELTSEKFKKIFDKADVIIAKGQGNLEGLIDIPGNIYYLLVTKCELIGNRVGTRRGEFVVKRGLNNQKISKDRRFIS